jgi:hypothetical protein
LGKIVGELDSSLKGLNLGISSWVSFARWEEPPEWKNFDVGYAKVGNRWGIAVRCVSGDFSIPQNDNTTDEWLFNDAPRYLRLQAIDRVPELLENLVKDVVDFTDQITKKLKQMQELSMAISVSAKGREISTAISAFAGRIDKTVKRADAIPLPPTFDGLDEAGRIVDGPPPFSTGMVAGMGAPPRAPAFNSAKGTGDVSPLPYTKGTAGLVVPGKNKKL